jgi:tetratricopeptide (TPR) repeat protein
MARAANNLGAISNLKGAHDAALGSYRLALPTFRRLGKRREIAETLHNIAVSYRDLGELEEADEHERRAIDYAAEGIAPRVAAMGRIGRAEIALRRGDPHFAEGTAKHAAAALHELHDPLNEGDALRLLGAALAARGRYDEAHEAFTGALDRARERGHAILEGEILRDRAQAYLRHGDAERAQLDAERALAIFRKLGATAEVEALAARFAR